MQTESGVITKPSSPAWRDLLSRLFTFRHIREAVAAFSPEARAYWATHAQPEPLFGKKIREAIASFKRG